jgi:indolepyruvate ferredoxin oxidoreductase beta subunit
MKKLDLLITGVGGQGVILASDIIGEAALATGYDVKKTDTLGMAQRGGSVVSHMRIASRIWSPLIKEGEVDILVAFEKLEAARWGHYLRPGAIAIVNNQALPPLSVNLGNEHYPSDEEITDILRQRSDRIYFVDGTSHARELGNIRTLNMFMLGCVSLFLPLKVCTWKDSISKCLPSSIRQINIVAFDQGRGKIRQELRQLADIY